MTDQPARRPSPLDTPIPRRRALAVIGSSVAGMVLLEGCGSAATPAPRGWLKADVDPTSLRSDQPVTVRFAGSIAGADVAGSAWLVKRATGELVAFDPRCPHARCAYEWRDDAKFSCLCHDALFDLDGNVLSGPPPRPLDEFRVREVDGRVEIYLAADFSTPRPKA